MQFINSNRVKSAKYKLSQHRVQGERSTLSIFQVAQLMDVVKGDSELNQPQTKSVFFSYN